MAVREGPVRLWNRMMDEHGVKEGTRPQRDMMRDGVETYRERYNSGYRYSLRGSSLDAADSAGKTDSEAWMDGYLDAATGRNQYHIPFCPDHDSCS